MISAVILTKNEEKHIIDCIESLVWCDEIIIIDDYSSDRTRELIEHLHDKKITMYKRQLADDFSAQRNFGLHKATGDWVLFIDADERISTSLQYEIVQLINKPHLQTQAYCVKRTDILWGKEMRYGEVGNVQLLRLAKQNAGEWKGRVHETWWVKSETGILANPLLHYPHQTIGEFLQEINFYTDLRAQELYELKERLPSWQLAIYPVGKFLMNYFVKRGFLDGQQGLIIAILMSFHSFLVRAKLWTLWQRKESV